MVALQLAIMFKKAFDIGFLSVEQTHRFQSRACQVQL